LVQPSYFLALSLFRDFGLRIVSVDVDEQGLRTEELELLLEGGLRPKFVYTIPAYQNPTSHMLSDARRRHLVALAGKHGFHVLADEVYQLLGFEGAAPPPPPLCYYDTDAGVVLSMGSFAKILAPAMRLGWFQASPAGAPLLRRIYGCGQLDSSGGMNPVVSGVAHAFIALGHQAAHVAALRAELTRRATTLCDALDAHVAPLGATYTRPRGGYFVWIRLPRGLDGAALLARAAAGHRVRFQPGARFGSHCADHIRLSFSYYGAEDLREGARRLGEALQAELAERAAAAAASAAAAPVVPAPAPAAAQGVLRVAVHGASGRLGSLIVGLLGATPPHTDPAAPAVAAFAFAGALPRSTDAAAASLEALAAAADVVIDVSLPAGTVALLGRLRAAAAAAGRPPVPVVVGTTGLGAVEGAEAALAGYASAGGAVLVAANFSAGVPLLLALLHSIRRGGAAPSAAAAPGASTPTPAAWLPAGWHAEVAEVHHTAKRDAPSGTARRIVAALAAAGVHGSEEAAAIAAATAAAPATAASPPPVPVHALRLGDAVGTHTVFLAGPGERLELTHVATRRDVFAAGALRAAAWVAAAKPGVHYL